MSLSFFAKAILGTSSLLLSYGTTCQQITKKSDIKVSYVQTKQFNANNPIEDRLRIFKMKQIKGVAASVFDGHGGDLCAEYAYGNIEKVFNEKIKKNIKMSYNMKKMIAQSLQECYDDLQQGFKAVFKENLKNQKYLGVGSCALTTVITPSLIVVANAGDCEGAILGGRTIIKTNQRLNAGQAFEQQRLKKQFPNQPDIIKCIFGTNYCYVKGRLQPTRSLGDFYLKNQQYNFTGIKKFTGPYITHKPIITIFDNIQGLGKTLVIATDGLWDQLSAQQMNKILVPYHGTSQTAQKLFEAAIKKILARNKISSFEKLNQIPNRRQLHDDISIITVDLKKLIQQQI